jgi:hypothetical protein
MQKQGTVLAFKIAQKNNAKVTQKLHSVHHIATTFYYENVMYKFDQR